MKLSILTATYNRGELLKKLYESIKQNLFKNLEIEWLIMDDGSTDNTKNTVKEFQEENLSGLEIKYFMQENQGKMKAINNLMEYVTGELVIDCDSDDYFLKNAFENIYKNSEELLSNNNLYAIAFLRSGEYENIQGKKFENTEQETTMFDLYFKNGMDGEKILVFKTSIRKMYVHKLENNEKFVTEARMYYEIEEKYKIKCYNIEVVSGTYLEGGYTKKSLELFVKYPVGYLKYFEEILNRGTNGVKFNKRLYVIKHYILFTNLCNKKINLSKIKNCLDKVLTIILFIPGTIKSKIFIKKSK